MKTEQEILEANVIIASFMGYSERIILKKGESDSEFLKDSEWDRVANPLDPKGHDWKSVKDLKYHSSWDCLVPVIEKIGKLSIPKGWVSEPWATNVSWGINALTTSFCIGDNSLFITDFGIGTNGELAKKQFDLESSTIIKSYLAVINFIKWYNEKNVKQ